MLTVEHATFLNSIFVTLLANICSVTFVGWARSYVALLCGDDTCEQMGFLSLNPLMHVDLFFMVSFMLFGIGLGQYPPIDKTLIQRPYKQLKFYVVYFLNTILYLALAIISLSCLLVAFGSSILELFRTITLLDLEVVRYYPTISSFSLSMALIGVAMVYINGLLAVFSLFINLLRLIGIPLLNKFFGATKYKEIWVIVGAIVSMYLLLKPLQTITAWIIFGTGYALAHFVGIGA